MPDSTWQPDRRAEPSGVPVQRHLLVDTDLGSFEISLNEVARDTCDYFASAAATGAFDRGSVFRIVSREQHVGDSRSPIDVVQVGTVEGLNEHRHRIRHEHTDLTGIHHKKWVVSAARYAPGEVYQSFFVCMKDEPELDYGGNRNEDRQGFAAFGQVVAGFSVLCEIFNRAEARDELAHPIRINTVRVKFTDGD